MKFHTIAIDLGGGLDNPGMMIALAICALTLAIFMVRSWRSGRSLSRRLLTVGAIFLIGVVLAPGAARMLLVGTMRLLIALGSGDQPDGIGFITSTPRFVAPLAALIVAALAEAVTIFRRRLRASPSSGKSAKA